MKITERITALLFVDSTCFFFIVRFAFGLYHSRIGFLCSFLPKKKEDVFQKKNEQLSHSRCCLLPSLFHWKLFSGDWYIFVAEYFLRLLYKSLNMRKQLFHMQ